MNSLIWNCRGIKKTGVSTFLRNLILEHNFHIIGLQETMQADIDDRLLRAIDPATNYLWKWVPSQGKSGGILSGINLEFYDVGGFHEGKHFLQLNLWDKTLNAQDENKPKFLAELAHCCSASKEPYMIAGDFNIIRFTSEKNKDTGLSRFSGLFNSIIAAHELIDLHMTGGKFTWSNNQSPPTLERLDIILVRSGQVSSQELWSTNYQERCLITIL